MLAERRVLHRIPGTIWETAQDKVGGLEGKEGGMWWASQVAAISVGGASYLDEIGAGVDNEKEALRRHAKIEGNEVLADTDIGLRVDRKIGFVV
ncbi:hypothetical protein L2E82_27079 [Cichorium intybus]|uniref:Uncharacterized protein n=1 Tax=Cichorium intybus TaxID=13427 RepID=A0ACB9CRZ0_CICIN|nr:hypothetical protein L2E82_27079 [Cichorium intybus]